jgi:hypothetical protein
MVLRHPAAVALATRKWTGYGPPGTRRFLPKRSLRSLLEHWIVAHARLDEDRAAIADIELVRFEDVIRDPAVIVRLRRKFGLVERPDRVEVPSRLDPRYRLQWRHWIGSPLGVRARETWLGEMEPAFERWGYAIDDDF